MDCLARGGDLLRISDPAVWSTIKTRLTAGYPQMRYWIGLAGTYWYWNDGKILSGAQLTSINFPPLLTSSGAIERVSTFKLLGIHLDTNSPGPHTLIVSPQKLASGSIS